MFGSHNDDNQHGSNGHHGQTNNHDNHTSTNGGDHVTQVSPAAPPDDNVFTNDSSNSQQAVDDQTSPPSDSVSPVNKDLLEIKQQALQQLTPLVSHLDQSAEEKFRTTMMMIQASDDQSLLGAAYEAAKNISDDKTRAQALLDIVNEINYFTQQPEK
jgi:hypothetical protein